MADLPLTERAYNSESPSTTVGITSQLWETFPALTAASADFSHAFTLRHPSIDVSVDRDEALRRLWIWHEEVAADLGFTKKQLITAEQIHGKNVAVAEPDLAVPVQGTDGLICAEPGLMLGIYVADCCAVYLLDTHSGAWGVLHAGRKGAELGITVEAIEQMKKRFGVKPQNLIVQLSPCIRPPVFEIDFAALIKQQANEAGVPLEQIHDDGRSTASDITKFYSYRVEKGKTGRMLALMGRQK